MPKITPNTLFLVNDLFNEKKWVINNSSKSINPYFRFCERLKLFETDKQEFIINLTHDFIKIDLIDYLEKFYDSLICLGDKVFERKEKIFVYPLIKPFLSRKIDKDTGEEVSILKIPHAKTKSSNFLHYMFESDDWTWLSEKFIIDNSISNLKKKFSNDDSILILIDDYVGSGRTAYETCAEYLNETFNNEKLKIENIKVVSIAAQNEGIKKVKDLIGVEVISNIKLNKGISDKFSSNEVDDKLALMKLIEDDMKIDKMYSLGLEQTEALITFLNKTPNNTFPVYWHETKKLLAPFPRYKNYRKSG